MKLLRLGWLMGIFSPVIKVISSFFPPFYIGEIHDIAGMTAGKVLRLQFPFHFFHTAVAEDAFLLGVKEKVAVEGLYVAEIFQDHLIFASVIGDDEGRLLLHVPAADKLVKLRLETAVLQRLYNVIGGLVFVAFQSVLGESGKENDADALILLADPLRGPEAVHQFHLYVKKNQIKGRVIFFYQVKSIVEDRGFDLLTRLQNILRKKLFQMIHKDSFVVADGDVQHMGVLSFCLVY